MPTKGAICSKFAFWRSSVSENVMRKLMEVQEGDARLDHASSILTQIGSTHELAWIEFLACLSDLARVAEWEIASLEIGSNAALKLAVAIFQPIAVDTTLGRLLTHHLNRDINQPATIKPFVEPSEFF